MIRFIVGLDLTDPFARVRAAGVTHIARLCRVGKPSDDRDGDPDHHHDGRETGEVGYFLSSLPTKVKTLAERIRRHWSIENQLHWALDVTFTEEASRVRKRHAPRMSAMLRRLAASISSSDTSMKDSLRGKRY